MSVPSCRVQGGERRFVLVLVGLVAAAVTGCGQGQELTGASLDEARAKWQEAAVKGYDLEWVSRGKQAGHYLVYVRDGQMKQVRSVQPDGRELLLEPEQWSHDVEALFQLLGKELSAKAGTQPVRFKADGRLGYPSWIRGEAALGLSIDVIRLDDTPALKEPPRPPAPR